jgi:hypothetical protein
VKDNIRAEMTMTAINHNWWVRAGNRTVTFVFDTDPGWYSGRQYQAGKPVEPERRRMLVTVWRNDPDQPGWPDITWEQFVGAELFSGQRNTFDCGTTDPVVARNWLIDFGHKPGCPRTGHLEPTK